MSRADDCETVLRILADAPVDGLSIDELCTQTGWSNRLVNQVLADVIGQIANQKVRVRGSAVLKYLLKRKG